MDQVRRGIRSESSVIVTLPLPKSLRLTRQIRAVPIGIQVSLPGGAVPVWGRMPLGRYVGLRHGLLLTPYSSSDMGYLPPPAKPMYHSPGWRSAFNRGPPVASRLRAIIRGSLRTAPRVTLHRVAHDLYTYPRIKSVD